jgi:hypothetical protein
VIFVEIVGVYFVANKSETKVFLLNYFFVATNTCLYVVIVCDSNIKNGNFGTNQSAAKRLVLNNFFHNIIF